jgi:hypothetical protein
MSALQKVTKLIMTEQTFEKVSNSLMVKAREILLKKISNYEYEVYADSKKKYTKLLNEFSNRHTMIRENKKMGFKEYFYNKEQGEKKDGNI